MKDPVDTLPAEFRTPSLRSLPRDLKVLVVDNIKEMFGIGKGNCINGEKHDFSFNTDNCKKCHIPAVHASTGKVWSAEAIKALKEQYPMREFRPEFHDGTSRADYSLDETAEVWDPATPGNISIGTRVRVKGNPGKTGIVTNIFFDSANALNDSIRFRTEGGKWDAWFRKWIEVKRV